MTKIPYYTQLIEEALKNLPLAEKPRELYQPISYILDLGGKRLRPALTLAACELYDGDIQKALNPALGIEVFHNFSLIHDDIMDAAPIRRGQQTVHRKWNDNIAILSGDAMLVRAYQLIAQVDNSILPQAMEVFSKTAMEVCEGQQYDLNFESQQEVSEADYIEMIRLKTSVLLGCALEIGGLVAGASTEQLKHLYDFGQNIGIAFQIQDDILDSFGETSKVGKQQGGDILKDKKTLLAIHALAKDPQLANWFGNGHADKVNAVRDIFNNTGAKAYAEERMRHYYQNALSSLKLAGGNEAIQKELSGFAAFLIERES